MALSRTLDALSEQAPCGEDLEYDASFLEMETLARGKAEQQFGETIVAAEAPDWKSVIACCDGLLERTRDLRVLRYLTQGLISEHGVVGAADGYALVLHAAEQHWDTIHPQLDADDDNDPTMRLNALSALTDPSSLGDGPRASVALRASKWFAIRGAACTVRQALACLGKFDASASDESVSADQLEKMIRTVAQADATNYARNACTAITALSALLSDKVGSHRAPDFRPILTTLTPLADFFDRVTGQTSELATPDDGTAQTAPSDNLPAGAVPSGTVRSRQDAVDALERVCEFLERQEPSHPAPLLIRRAQRLLTMNFLDIMKDLAPDALVNIENIAGTNRINATE